jgi:hypothetical protein
MATAKIIGRVVLAMTVGAEVAVAAMLSAEEVVDKAVVAIVSSPHAST